MKRLYVGWTDEQLKFLRNNYGVISTVDLVAAMHGRKWGAITKKASVLGLHHSYFGAKKSDISILLHDNPISYYWMGFLMADGSFSDRRIYLGVAGKDLDHLKCFAKFINSTNKIKKMGDQDHYRIKVTSVREVRALKEKFCIASDKTHNPCDIKNIKDRDLLFSLIIGYIDGDGSVSSRKKFPNCHCMHLVGHPSWLDNFIFMKNFLYEYFGDNSLHSQPKLRKSWVYLPQDKTKTKKMYVLASFQISKKSLLVAMRAKAEELNLPFLKRKLGKITC